MLSLLMGLGGAAIAWVALSEPREETAYMQDNLQENAPQNGGNSQGDLNMGQPDASGSSESGGKSDLPQSVTIQKNNGTEVITTSGKVGDEDLSYADVVALVKNSVVEITTNYVVSGTMFSQYVSSGAGSGVIFAQEDKVGYIVTNNHVVEDATSIKVRLADGTELDATMIGTDAATDLAVLVVNTDLRLTTAVLGDSDSLIVGQEVLAIGNPLGQLGGTVTNGIVSALEREVTIDGENMTLMQTNAAVNPGNSGGGLFNMRGELIGVVNAKSSGDDVEGLGFAIPANTVYEIISQLIEHGYVRGRPALGITVNMMRQQYFMQYITYIYVTDPGKTQLQVNDILYAIEGKEIVSSEDITAAISGKTVGDKVEIVVLRNNKEVKVEVELIEYVPEGAQP
ncbi:MAG: trypsin-like peptidase domain-containing protein [Clostridia bacterium]|nr:trypsin-like peptidase domain-containing protein [Clostridia bacterium]